MAQNLVDSIDSLVQPADSYRRLSEYQRSTASTNTDLFLELQNDLSVSNSGDLSTLTGVDLITQSLIRRLHTPSNGFRRWVRSPSGVTLVDTTYGNRTYDYLSSPVTNSLLTEVEKATVECLSSDSRIEVLDVKAVQADYTNAINIRATYRILGEEDLKSLFTVLSSSLLPIR